MTNAVLNLCVLAVLLAACARRLRGLRRGPLLWTALAMIALTAVFDTAKIAAGLYSFDPARILGLRVAGAPIEDFAYPLAAVAAMPALWMALGARKAAGADRSGGAAASREEEGGA